MTFKPTPVFTGRRVAAKVEGPAGFGEAAPGAYPLRAVRADGEAGVVGWLVVSPGRATAIVNLDLSRLEAPPRRDGE